MAVPQVISPHVPAPPSLLPDDPPEDRTNTAALLLPHLALFAPPILQILRDHYENYGKIAHWAPVKAFGRVIIVWEEVEFCQEAKRQGDFLKLDVDIPDDTTTESSTEDRDQSGLSSTGYFRSKPRRNKPYVRNILTARRL
jgi:hypothetical protein